MKKPKNARKLRVFDSMSQASSALGISKDSIQQMKSEGCPAFRGSRIHERELLEWAQTRKLKAAPKAPVSPGDELELRLLQLGKAVVELDDFIQTHRKAFGWIGNLTNHLAGIVVALRDVCVEDGHFQVTE